MAKKSTASKKKATESKKSFEQTLWETADKLRGTVESPEYKGRIKDRANGSTF